MYDFWFEVFIKLLLCLFIKSSFKVIVTNVFFHLSLCQEHEITTIYSRRKGAACKADS